MSRKKVSADDKCRIQVVASREQAKILDEAAIAAGCADRSTWMLAHALKAARVENVDSAPLIVSGPVADRVRAEAKRQGTSADAIIEQLLIAG